MRLFVLFCIYLTLNGLVYHIRNWLSSKLKRSLCSLFLYRLQNHSWMARRPWQRADTWWTHRLWMKYEDIRTDGFNLGMLCLAASERKEDLKATTIHLMSPIICSLSCSKCEHQQGAGESYCNLFCFFVNLTVYLCKLKTVITTGCCFDLYVGMNPDKLKVFRVVIRC